MNRVESSDPGVLVAERVCSVTYRVDTYVGDIVIVRVEGVVD